MSSGDPFLLAPFLRAFQGAPGASLLDLGCGTGRHAHALGLAGFRVCALDADLDALATARSLYPGLVCCAGEAGALPFAVPVFDAVVCIDVLHWSAHAAAFEAAWREAWRVLRPGGLFCARLRFREFSAPEANWFLADRGMLDALAAGGGGEWVEPATRDGDSGMFLLRKPA